MVIEMAFQPRVNLLFLHCGRSFLKLKAGPPPWQQSSPLLSDHRTLHPPLDQHGSSEQYFSKKLFPALNFV
jgi:hypothetical protein